MAESSPSSIRRTARKLGRRFRPDLRIQIRDDDDVESDLPSAASSVSSVGDDSGGSDIDSPSPTTTTFPPAVTTTKIAPSGALGAAAPTSTEEPPSIAPPATKSLPPAETIPTTPPQLATTESTSAPSTTSSSTSTFTSTSISVPPALASTSTVFGSMSQMQTILSTIPPLPEISSISTSLPIATGAPPPSGVDSSLTPEPQDTGTQSTEPPSTKSRMGAQAGIALGSIAGIAVVVSLGFCLYKWRKRRRPASDGSSARGVNELGGNPERPWTRLTGPSWLGLRKPEARTESGIIDEMMRAAYDAENGGMNYPTGMNGYLDEKNAGANGLAPLESNAAGYPLGASTPRLAELASYDLRTPQPNQAPRYSFLDQPPTALDRPPSAYWIGRRSVASSVTTTSTAPGRGHDLVSPETPSSTSSGALSWFRKDPAKRMEQERRRVLNVEAAHMKLVGQHAGSGLNKTLHSRVAETRAEAAMSVAVTEATTSDGTWKTWGLEEKRDMPRVKNWLDKCLEKGGLK